MKLDTVSVAPPGPPDVTLITMSASFSWKMILSTIAVTLTGSISGKVICQKDCQGVAPSTLAASGISFGQRLQAGEQQDHDEWNPHPGIHGDDAEPGDPGRREEGGIVPAEMAGQRRGRAEAVFHQRLADHPAHRDRAQHEGQQEGDAEELAGPDLGIEQERQTEGDRILDEHGQHVVDHVAERVPEIGIAEERSDIVEAVELAPGERAQVPVGEGDVEAEEGREDHHERR